MKMMVTDCYTETQQLTFMQGIAELDSACDTMHNKAFMQCDVVQRKELLISLEKEAKTLNGVRRVINKTVSLLQNVNQKNDPSDYQVLPNHYYTMMKQLTLLGF